MLVRTLIALGFPLMAPALAAAAPTITHMATYADRSAGADSKPDRTLVNTYWKLVQVRGAASIVVAGQREPHLILQIDGNRVVGSGGCNRLMGKYTLHGDFLGLGEVAATKMACAEGTQQEAAFLGALAQVKSWRVRGDGLTLLDAANAPLLQLVAVDFK